MRTFKIELESVDVCQLLDALSSRAEAYENTASLLRGEGTDEFFVPEEVDDAEEADRIAAHFRDIIETVEKQMGAQSGK